MEAKLWYSVPEASEYLGISKALLYNLMKGRKLPFYYISGTRQRRLKKEDLDALLVPGNPDEADQEDNE